MKKREVNLSGFHNNLRNRIHTYYGHLELDHRVVKSVVPDALVK